MKNKSTAPNLGPWPYPLPIDRHLAQIASVLKQHAGLVLTAPPGSGKTTRVPPALLRAGLLDNGNLLLLQPRRVAARAGAHSMAQLLGEQPGQTIGYQVRFDKKSGPKTRIHVVTEGILTRRLVSDPLLENTTCVILDEFHERSIHTDLALALLSELQSLRDDLKLVVMSATMSAQPLLDYLPDAVHIDVKARPHPLQIRYLDQPLDQSWSEGIATGLQNLLQDPSDDRGDILVFLPGSGEIERCRQELQARFNQLDFYCLYGALPADAQDAALAPKKRRAVILATNIAETSLTVAGVTAVIDGGKRKILTHDHSRGIDRLDLVRISQASADQRAGRAGRTGPGRAVRLWSQTAHLALPPSDLSEIQRVDLAAPLLQIIDFHGPQIETFPFYETAPKAAQQTALKVLKLLSAIDQSGRITPLGKRLLRWPLHPRLAILMEQTIAAGQASYGAALAACLSEGTPGDLLETARTLEQSLQGDAQSHLPYKLRAAAQQLLRTAQRHTFARQKSAKTNPTNAPRWLAAAFPDRIARTTSTNKALMVGGRGLKLPPGAYLQSDYLVALAVTDRGADRSHTQLDSYIHLQLEDILSVCPVETLHRAIYDEGQGSVTGVRHLVLDDLVLKEDPSEQVAAEQLAETLAQAAANLFERWFKPDQEALQLWWRMRFAAQHDPQHAWPALDPENLCKNLPQWCYGKRSLRDLARSNWKSALMELLDHHQRRRLAQLAPETLQVPSGSHIKIDYSQAFSDTGFPVLAVRLQELFGLKQTPKVADGNVPILLHLLAPNMRPAQVTRDLENFWNSTYHEVRKELRQRYPKHYWPEDPWQAEPTRGTRRKSSKN